MGTTTSQEQACGAATTAPPLNLREQFRNQTSNRKISSSSLLRQISFTARRRRRSSPPDLLDRTTHIRTGCDEPVVPAQSNSMRRLCEYVGSTNPNEVYQIIVPHGVLPGDLFQVKVNKTIVHVRCPAGCRPNQALQINSKMSIETKPWPLSSSSSPSQPCSNPNTGQMFEVKVPAGAQPGRPFALTAGGHRVLVTVPANAKPGQSIRFRLPASFQPKADGSPPTPVKKKKKTVLDIRLSYDKDGWARTIRVTDLKFQWIRMDNKGDVDFNNERFDRKTSAYVRKIEFEDSGDPSMRGGTLSLVPASQAVGESKILLEDGSDLVSYANIAQAQVKSFDNKVKWFQSICRKISADSDKRKLWLHVRRDFLLIDSVEAIMSLTQKDLKRVWRFEFLGEEGIDAGGLTREWFQLVTEEIFNPDNGLWQSSATNQMCMQINPSSKLACPDDHLLYFRFLGRVMGKALFDKQLVAGHMVRHLYKHILGWPVTFDDLEIVDEEYYNSLKKVADYNDEELEMMCLDFTCTESIMGAVEEIELVEGGADIPVTTKNLPEYLECCLKYRMMGRVEPQLKELLLGFFDVIPEPLMAVFDFQELELLMCGLPNIDIDDWKKHTRYTGLFDDDENHEVCKWFWEVVENEFDQELRARLLQYITGTSGVPSRGFSVLQGNGNNIRKFTIHGVQLEQCLYPRAHTCFNSIDLPCYTSKEQLHEKLDFVVKMEATGFNIQ